MMSAPTERARALFTKTLVALSPALEHADPEVKMKLRTVAAEFGVCVALLDHDVLTATNQHAPKKAKVVKAKAKGTPSKMNEWSDFVKRQRVDILSDDDDDGKSDATVDFAQ